MPNIEFDAPYDAYVKKLIHSGLFRTYSEVVKDALRLHMNTDSEAKRVALIHEAIAEGENDIQAGRHVLYSPELIDQLTAEVIQENAG